MSSLSIQALHEISIIAKVIIIVTNFLAFVLMHTQKNEANEYQIFGREFWRNIGVYVYSFLCIKKKIKEKLEN